MLELNEKKKSLCKTIALYPQDPSCCFDTTLINELETYSTL